MEQHAYRQSAVDARQVLEMAIVEAEESLPDAVMGHHWQAKKSAPTVSAAWQAVRFWYGRQAHIDTAVQQTIDDLYHLTAAAAHINTLLLPLPTAPPDLRLPRHRRTA